MRKISRFAGVWTVAVLLGVCGGVSSAHALVSPISVAIIPPVQFPPSDFTVAGLRVSALWGSHRNVYGFDFGAVGNITQQDFTGLGVSGIFNMTHGSTNILGLQVAGLANVNTQKANIYGLQATAGVNYNEAESTLVGLEVALGNYSPHMSVYGLQVGIYNRALSVAGFQIGLVNDTEVLHGLQIGLINFHRKGLFAVSPILNFGF
jgi:hypothetical protein